MLSKRQQRYVNSPFVHPYLKECMKLSLGIRDKEAELENMKPVDQRIEELIEKELEIIQILKDKGYTELTPVEGFKGYYPVKQCMESINNLTKLLAAYETRKSN